MLYALPLTFYEILIAFFIFSPLFWLRVVKEEPWHKIKEQLFGHYQGHKKELVGSLALFSALLLGFFAISLCITAVETLTGTGINDLSKVGEAIQKSFAAGAGNYALTLIIVLFAEEFFFRAFLVPRTGIVISTLFFTAMHIGYGSAIELIGVFALGLILAYWYKKKRSLLQNYLGHLLYDLLAIMLYLV